MKHIGQLIASALAVISSADVARIQEDARRLYVAGYAAPPSGGRRSGTRAAKRAARKARNRVKR